MSVAEKGRRAYWKEAVGVLIFLIVSFSSYAQKPIKGIVIDSITFAPLPGVNIQIKNTSRGTATDGKGEFRLLIKKTDTLIFSLVGYLKEEFAATELEETTLIRMAEEIHLLQTITVFPRADEKYIKPITIRAKGALMNYGPSGAGVNFAYFSKGEREKRKLNFVLTEQAHQKNYIKVVTSDEVRERLIYDFHLTEDQYYQILARFNIENGDSLYDISSEELIVIMNVYFKDQVGR